MGFLPVGQTGLELPTAGDPPALASQSAGITDVSHSGGFSKIQTLPCHLLRTAQPHIPPAYSKLLIIWQSHVEVSP